MAAIVNLNHHASYAHWHFFQMSVSNVIVIALMVVAFVLAIVVRFPGHGVSGDSS
jgi:Flp pilus assembly protein protease CpaA